MMRQTLTYPNLKAEAEQEVEYIHYILGNHGKINPSLDKDLNLMIIWLDGIN